MNARVSCAKNGWTDLSILYDVVCVRSGLLGVVMIAPVKFLMALIFKIAVNSLTR